MKFVDTVTIKGTKTRDSDGALIVDARAARTGIQVYAGAEVDRPDLERVTVFRGADEVFDKASLASFAHRPITVDHPPVPVDASNWKDYAVGQTADEVTANDIYVRVPLMVSDGNAINTVKSGKRELSVGYDCDLDWTPGITQDGVAFDARQRNIRVNHIAIVDRGRAGSNVRIGDYASPIETKDEGSSNMNKTMIVDGFPIADVSPAAEMVIVKLQDQIAKLNTSASTLATDHAKVLADRDVKIGELTAENKKLTDAALTGDKLDQMVADRANLVSVATKLVPDLQIKGLSDAAIKTAVVKAKLGDDAVKDQNDAAIGGMFTVIARDVKTDDTTDAVRQAFVSPTPAQTQTVKDANDPRGYEARNRRLQDAWKDQPAGQA